MNILHLTDLHISNPNPKHKDDPCEALRESYYKEYLEGFLDTLKQDDCKVDMLVLTGDFVDRAKFTNYDHVSNIIKYVAQSLCIDLKNVYVTNGNHDIDRNKKLSNNKEEFIKFSNQFGGEVVDFQDRYKLHKYNNNLGILCLDSVGALTEDGEPTNLSISEEDDIIDLVRSSSFDQLIVLSHHPAESYSVQNEAPFDESAPNWSGAHIWHAGGNIFKRLSSKTVVKEFVYWFSGDIHRPEFTIIDNKKILVVGASCNSISGQAQNINPQINLLSISDSILNLQLKRYKKEASAHNNKAFLGNWTVEIVDPKHYGSESKKIDKPHDEYPLLENTGDTKIRLINPELEEELYRNVSINNLYTFGLYENSGIHASLGWISISPMLNNSSLYRDIINKFRETIESLISSDISKNSCILLGIDHWGAILAARLGIATNIRSCFLASNSENRKYEPIEVINDELQSVMKNKKMIFVISDVISTGNTIKTISNSVLYDSESSWYNLTLFFDIQQDKEGVLDNYSQTFYACGKVRIPIIHKEKIPEDTMLRPTIVMTK